jgi:hypothetical protein
LCRKAFAAVFWREGIQLRHSETTFVDAEFSNSKGPGFSLSRSNDGGLTNSDRASPEIATSQQTPGGCTVSLIGLAPVGHDGVAF